MLDMPGWQTQDTTQIEARARSDFTLHTFHPFKAGIGEEVLNTWIPRHDHVILRGGD